MGAFKLSDNAKTILVYLQAHDGEELTAADVAEAVSLPKKTVDSCFTMSLQKHELGVRTPAEIELEDGTHKTVKFLSLTDAGLAYEPPIEE